MKEIRNNNKAINRFGRNVSGYVFQFNTIYNDGGIGSIIDAKSLTGVIEKSDVLFLFNYDENRGCLARCNKGKGSLKLSVDNKGLKYEFEMPNTAFGDELLEGIERGDIYTLSYQFSVNKEEWKGIKSHKGPIRNIKFFDRIFCLSLVYRPVVTELTFTNFIKRLIGRIW